MRIEINGEPHESPAGITVEALLTELGIDPRSGAVERNREIVPKSAYGITVLRDGDCLEIIQFVGGG
jgi:thiamine biosynthesis protein ThiS